MLCALATAARTSFLHCGPALAAVNRHAARVETVEREERREEKRKQRSELCGRCGLQLGCVGARMVQVRARARAG